MSTRTGQKCYYLTEYLSCILLSLIQSMSCSTEQSYRSLTYLLHGAEFFLRSWLVLQLIKKFPAFYGTRKIITVLTAIDHLHSQRYSKICRGKALTDIGCRLMMWYCLETDCNYKFTVLLGVSPCGLLNKYLSVRVPSCSSHRKKRLRQVVSLEVWHINQTTRHHIPRTLSY